MLQLYLEKTCCEGIPVRIVHSIRDEGKALLLYHGWSSRGEYQTTKAAVFALHGYTVFVPDAIHHGERDALSDYYRLEDYSIFWETIRQNVREYEALHDFVREKGYGTPIIAGHSMGGMSVLGIAARYPQLVRSVISFNGSGDWILSHLFMQARFGISLGRNWPLYDALEKSSRCPI